MWKGFSTCKKFQLNILACLIGVLLIFLIVEIFVHSKKTRIDPEENPHSALSPDVDSVMRDFKYQDSSNQANVNITGKEAALRGRKVMVFRSNLSKTTYFKEVNGTITSKKRAIIFSADTGEWDTSKNSPFSLERNVHLTIDGKSISGVKSIGIYFNRQTLEANGRTKTIYSF